MSRPLSQLSIQTKVADWHERLTVVATEASRGRCSVDDNESTLQTASSLMVAICGVNSRRTGGQVDVVQCLERVAGRDRLCCQATWLTPRSALRTSSTPSCMPLPSVVLTAVVVAAAAESTAHHRCPATQQKCIVRRRRLTARADDGMLPMRRFV